MIVLTLKFLLAHILGDFVFQSDKWVKNKRKFKLKSPKLYLHILIHGLFLILALQFDFSYWLGILIVLLSHFVIDIGKLYAEKKWNNISLFFIDQFLHLAVILGVVQYYAPYNFNKLEIYYPQILLLAVAVLLVTVVTSILMRVLISKWGPMQKDGKSLKNAGAYIGMLERLFIFGFIILNFWAGIGFLLGAKSIFRFGDLTNSKDRNLTEYVLIGTLLSFGFAIMIGVGYNWLRIVIGLSEL
ncbi:DUF3307 domain-containing protein [Brumimicrobium mesophilum]|uniref:DUF3307 domain-containing protein n=1 Tax=Brumimicrobium mesophilum TaxID=392717 RepID=UPI000D14121A|nr:DUF3307 domain-containing protein [Brumimicrobium mesophilum]